MPDAPEDHASGDVAATLVDAAGTILDITAPAAAIVDATPGDLIGTRITRHIHRDDRELAARLLDEAITDGASGPVELRILIPTGGWVWLRGVSVRQDLDPPTVSIRLADASEARRLADQLERTTHDLQREHAELMRRSAAMADLAGLLTSVDNVGYLIRGISGVALRHLAPLVAVLLVDDDGLRVVHIGHADAAAEELLRSSLAHLEGGVFSLDGAISDAILSGEPRVNFRGPFHPQLPDLLAEFRQHFDLGARAVFPMRTRREWIGALIVARAADEPDFSQADVDLARMLAGRAALAVDAARSDALRREAEALSRRRAAQQAAIAELGTLALAGGSLEELTAACREKVCAALDAVHCGAVVSDDPVDPALGAALDSSGSVVVDDLADGSPFALDGRLRSPEARSLVLCRIQSRSGPAGLLSASSTEPGAFGSEEAVFLGAMANVLASAVDAREAMARLQRLALHDTLTGLPNRDLVLQALQQALAQNPPGMQVAVLVCDVDRFKVVNDALGHAAGDDVLKAVATRLAASVRPGDIVGRFGGDEFVVVCPQVAHVDAVVAIADRLAATFSSPVSVMGTAVVATASLGIAMSDDQGGLAASDLLRDADAAMYRAKENGRARFEIFDDGMRARASRRLRTETDLRRAFEAGELVMHYQPIVGLRDQKVLGVEALARWDHPDRGTVPPDQFVGVAVECGLAPDLAEWALQTAATQAVIWTELGPLAPSWVAVNLAATQLSDPRLLSRIDTVLARTGVDPARLRIEVTEEALVEDTMHSARILAAIRERGLGISIDDFGTGYSSLAYLKRLPVDCLKLDGGFVQKLGEDDDDMVIAAAVVVMAGALGLDVVAECVETVTQMQVLRAMGCDQVQGHVISPPLPAAELEEWLRTGPVPAAGA